MPERTITYLENQAFEARNQTSIEILSLRRILKKHKTEWNLDHEVVKKMTRLYREMAVALVLKGKSQIQDVEYSLIEKTFHSKLQEFMQVHAEEAKKFIARKHKSSSSTPLIQYLCRLHQRVERLSGCEAYDPCQSVIGLVETEKQVQAIEDVLSPILENPDQSQENLLHQIKSYLAKPHHLSILF